MLWNNIPISIYYDLHNDGTNKTEQEHKFGIVNYEYEKGKSLNYIN